MVFTVFCGLRLAKTLVFTHYRVSDLCAHKKLKDRITPQVNFFQQATKERQRRHGVSKKEKRDGEGLVWRKLCVDEYV